ncbi:Phospholipase/Carboxylesterase [Melampsora americana]|nr:Phospholipase/Carboxylesterase [Melampsora americana]
MTPIDLVINQLPASSPSKPHPRLDEIIPEIVYEYLPSPDDIDSNLIIMFHGLGDTPKPFTNLAKTLKLPQTAFLIIRAFERVPLLEEEAFQWWDSFDPLTGDPVTNPNPSKSLSRLNAVLDHLLSNKIGWHASTIHLFGFAQGGSCAAELLVNRTRKVEAPNGSNQLTRPDLGSLVTISGPLLSLPTISPETRSQTPTLLWVRKHEDTIGRWRASFAKGFTFVEHFTASIPGQDGQPSMPRGQEWDPVMKYAFNLLNSVLVQTPQAKKCMGDLRIYCEL